jgi:hypothetical protein
VSPEAPFHLSFPDVVLPPMGARPLTLAEIPPTAPAPAPAPEPIEVVEAARPAPDWLIALVVALSVVVLGLGVIAIIDPPVIEEQFARVVSSLGASVAQSVAQSAEWATAVRAFR